MMDISFRCNESTQCDIFCYSTTEVSTSTWIMYVNSLFFISRSSAGLLQSQRSAFRKSTTHPLHSRFLPFLLQLLFAPLHPEQSHSHLPRAASKAWMPSSTTPPSRPMAAAALSATTSSAQSLTIPSGSFSPSPSSPTTITTSSHTSPSPMHRANGSSHQYGRRTIDSRGCSGIACDMENRVWMDRLAGHPHRCIGF